MGRYDEREPRFEMLAKNLPFHALLDAVNAGAEAERKQTKPEPEQRGGPMAYIVEFMPVELEADSEAEALTKASQQIATDPGFYVRSVKEEDNKSWVSV